MNFRNLLPILPLWLSFGLPLQAQAKQSSPLRLSGIFGNHMVLQQETQAPIWGWATAGAAVTLEASWTAKTLTTRADAAGRWQAVLETPKAGGPHQIVVQSEAQEIELEDVLTGEVWVCSGQSNMQWKMRGFGPEEFKEDVARAQFPEIRYCAVPQVLSLEKQTDTQASWSVCNPQSVLNYSAVAYFFGARLHEELAIPIGLVSTNWGGSSAEAWIQEETLRAKFPAFQAALDNYPGIKGASGTSFSRQKKAPKGLNMTSPSVLYNAMIHPVAPFAMRGVIWYQGESNVRFPEQYRELFPALIKDWRRVWSQGDFPFYFVQIAPFIYKQEPKPVALLREAQLLALSVPNTGMAVTMDLGEADNIHPRAKKPVGERLALLALAKDYGRSELVFSGPLLKEARVEGRQMALAFEHLGGGLASRDGEPLSHFMIAGEDRVFHPAEAIIAGDIVQVQSPKVPRPVAVRYGWGNADCPNLMNREGLPASSFRTDEWTDWSESAESEKTAQ